MRKALLIIGLLAVAGFAAAQDAQQQTTSTVTETNTATSNEESSSQDQQSSVNNSVQDSTVVTDANGQITNTTTSNTSTENSSSSQQSNESQQAQQNSKDNTTSTTTVNPDGTETTIVTTTTTNQGFANQSSSQTSTNNNEAITTTTVITTITNSTAAPVNIPVTTSEVPKGDCTNGMDMCFAIDRSGSLDQDGFLESIEWARQMGRKLDQDTEGKSHFGNVLFGTAAVNVTDNLKDFPTFEGALNTATWGGLQEATNLGGGVESCAQQIISMNRSRPSFIFLLTDGNPNMPSPDGLLDPAAYAFIAADGAKRRGIFIVSVAVTGIQGLNSTLLQLMASTNEAGPLYFPINSTASLPGTVDRLVDFLCNYDGGEVEGQDTGLDSQQLQEISNMITQTLSNQTSTSTSTNTSTFLQESYTEFVNTANATVPEDPTLGTGRVCGVKPHCRMYIEDAVCCNTNELVTSRPSAYVTLLCTDPIMSLNASCIGITGPSNVTTVSVFNGANTCGTSNYFRYLVNWGWAQYMLEGQAYPDTMWNGTLDINPQAGLQDPAMADMCALTLAAPCAFEGVAYYNVSDVVPMKLTVNNAPDKAYNLINYSNRTVDLHVLDSMSWMDLEQPTMCKTQHSVWLPPAFYQEGGWLGYNEGFQYACMTETIVPPPALESDASTAGR